MLRLAHTEGLGEAVRLAHTEGPGEAVSLARKEGPGEAPVSLAHWTLPATAIHRPAAEEGA